VARRREKVELAPAAKTQKSTTAARSSRRRSRRGGDVRYHDRHRRVVRDHPHPGADRAVQRYIVHSHSAGAASAARETVRAAICSRINVLSNGNSGIRLKVVECMVDMLNKGVTPVVFDKGSVGACGDLSPMSQMALVLLGEGERSSQGRAMSGAEAMKAAGVNADPV